MRKRPPTSHGGLFGETGPAPLAGVDEAGRGALFGPVVAAAVILGRPDHFWEGVRDSKKVPAGEREILFEKITSEAASWAVGLSSPEEIDRINILRATMLAMRRAVEALKVEPALVIVDGNATPRIKYPCQAVVRGDETSVSIAAASIVAKVWRDRLIRKCSEQFPGFGLDKNKGYGTAGHLDALRRFGPTDQHRRSFRGVASPVEEPLPEKRTLFPDRV